MLNNKEIAKRLKNDFLLILPQEEKVLSVKEFTPDYDVTSSNRSRLRIPIIALLGVMLAFSLIFTGIGLNRNDGSSLNAGAVLSESESEVNDSDSTNNQKEIKRVIDAGNKDNFVYIGECIPKRSETYISDTLKSKIEQFKGQDVLYRVIVELLFTEEDMQYIEDNYSENGVSIKSIMNKIVENNILYDQGSITHDELNTLNSELEKERRILYSNYAKQIYNKKIEFIKSLGVTEMQPVSETSDDVSYFGHNNGYIMELTEEQITAMIKYGGFAFKLARPKRIPGYDIKITDALTGALEKSQENEVFHVAVITVVDKYNGFVRVRLHNLNYNYNIEYNSHLNKEWQGIVNTENVTEYIDSILIRNNISDKHIINDKMLDIDLYNLSIMYAGFEALLTKEQIISLTADPDVKAIFYMDRDNCDDYIDLDE